MGKRPFGVYVHVPWCSSRCGYCDFNTYVPGSLAGATPQSFVTDAIAELKIARKVLNPDRDVEVNTVFFGGGTPTLLPPGDLVAVLEAIDSEFGLVPDAEVTTEANPESVNPESLAALRTGGFNRISLGMQSAVPHVLAVLDRVHTPGRAASAARWAFEAGFGEVSLDLIYGAPGESDADWRTSLDAVVEASPSHVSAYSLIVEPGTRMARQVANGELPPPDDDALAVRYEMADQALSGAGLGWYEVSNWAAGGAGGGSECRHNMGYWRNGDWWGIGPGAHSHVGGVRWWNLKHPATYATAVRAGRSPAAGREILTPNDQFLETVMLQIRLAEGLPLPNLTPGFAPENLPKKSPPSLLGRFSGATRGVLGELADDGLLEPGPLDDGLAVLTLRGRLLADLVVRRLLPA